MKPCAEDVKDTLRDRYHGDERRRTAGNGGFRTDRSGEVRRRRPTLERSRASNCSKASKASGSTNTTKKRRWKQFRSNSNSGPPKCRGRWSHHPCPSPRELALRAESAGWRGGRGQRETTRSAAGHTRGRKADRGLAAAIGDPRPAVAGDGPPNGTPQNWMMRTRLIAVELGSRFRLSSLGMLWPRGPGR